MPNASRRIRTLRILLPLAVLITVSCGSVLLAQQLRTDEYANIQSALAEQARVLRLRLSDQAEANIVAMQALGNRWSAAHRTPYALWQDDARHYLDNLHGIRSLQWIDRHGSLQWAEPVAEHTGMQRTLIDEARSKTIAFSPPTPMPQGYEAVIIYVPVTRHGKPDGFMAAPVDLRHLFASAIEKVRDPAIAIRITRDGLAYYEHQSSEKLSPLHYRERVNLLGTQWLITMQPTAAYMSSQRSPLPWLVLAMGTITALLLTAMVRSTVLLQKGAQQLNARQQQLLLLIKHTPAAVAMFDRNMRYIATSDRWIADYRLEGQALIGQSHDAIFPEMALTQSWRAMQQRALDGKSVALREDSWVRQDGSIEWIQWAAHPWRNEHGEIGGVVLFTEVITPRKQAELALRTSEETLRQAIDHSPIGMALVALDGRWMRVNQALSSMLGYTPEELQNTTFQQLTYPPDMEPSMELVKQILHGERTSYHLEKRYLRKDGSRIWVLLHVSLLNDEDDQPQYFIAQIEDIEAQKRAEKGREELIGQLAESNTELERFAYVASHDLREPARLICSYAELLQQEYADTLDDMAQKYIGICAKAAQRMHTLITDLLDYARIGRLAEQHEPFRTRDALAYVIDMLAVTIEAHNVEITHGTLPEVAGNKTSFTLLLQNLVANTITYQRPGVTPQIHIDAHRKGNDWVFSVRDNGIGIKPEFREQIFEPFKRLHSNDEYEGTGMGLAICRKIVERLGGRIWVESLPGHGSAFFFTLRATPGTFVA